MAQDKFVHPCHYFRQNAANDRNVIRNKLHSIYRTAVLSWTELKYMVIASTATDSLCAVSISAFKRWWESKWWVTELHDFCKRDTQDKQSRWKIRNILQVIHRRCVRCIEVRSKDSQVKTQLVLWIFILFNP